MLRLSRNRMSNFSSYDVEILTLFFFNIHMMTGGIFFSAFRSKIIGEDTFPQKKKKKRSMAIFTLTSSTILFFEIQYWNVCWRPVELSHLCLKHMLQKRCLCTAQYCSLYKLEPSQCLYKILLCSNLLINYPSHLCASTCGTVSFATYKTLYLNYAF